MSDCVRQASAENRKNHRVTPRIPSENPHIRDRFHPPSTPFTIICTQKS